MRYDGKFRIEGDGDCIVIRRSNGWLRILKSYWDGLNEKKTESNNKQMEESMNMLPADTFTWWAAALVCFVLLMWDVWEEL